MNMMLLDSAHPDHPVASRIADARGEPERVASSAVACRADEPAPRASGVTFQVAYGCGDPDPDPDPDPLVA